MSNDCAVVIVQFRSSLVAAGEVRKRIRLLKSRDRLRHTFAVGAMTGHTRGFINVLAGIELQRTFAEEHPPCHRNDDRQERSWNYAVAFFPHSDFRDCYRNSF